MEHIEEAGIHSGDSACSLPPYSLSSAIIVRAREADARAGARAQRRRPDERAVSPSRARDIYILEVNPRASRTVPFVAKVIGKPIAGIAARVMAGEPLAAFELKPRSSTHVAVKEAVFPFARFPGVDTDPGPRDALDRRGHGHRPRLRHGLRQEPARRRQRAARQGHRVRLGAGRRQGGASSAPCASCDDLGFRILATRGTKRRLGGARHPCEQVNKVLEGRPHIVDR